MLLSFSAVIVDVWNFLKRPTLDHLTEHFKQNPKQVIYYLLIFDFMLMLPLSGFLGMLGIEDMDHKIEDLADNPLALAGMAILAAPIIEEAIFRLPMKYSYARILIAVGLAFTIVATVVTEEVTLGIMAAIILGSMAIFHFLDQQTDLQLNKKIKPLWAEYFFLPFWLLTLAFAALHLTNFNDSLPWHLAPFLVLPQFVLGAIIGYVRTGYGFAYAVLFHALHNGVLVGLALMAQSFMPEAG